MLNFTDKQILEIVKRYDQECECVLEGEKNGLLSMLTMF